MQDFKPPIHLSDEDFAVITDNGRLLNEDGQVRGAFALVKDSAERRMHRERDAESQSERVWQVVSSLS